MSTADTDHGNGAGLDILGRYCECDVDHVVKEAAFWGPTGPSELAKFPLTFRAGHPYYAFSRTGDLDSFGRLSGSSWAAHVRNCAVKLDSSKLGAADSILLVETDPSNGRRPIVCLSGDVRLRGIVVRRGGILLIDDDVPVTTLRVNFILVETGGVLQAGAVSDSTDYLYRNRLNIILTHPSDGYGTMPVVASQCPYQVYAPGVQWVHDAEDSPPYSCPNGVCPKFSGFDGTSMCFTNAFAAKTLAIGFNGTCALCGQATPLVPYNGTWRSLAQDQLWTNGPQSLSIGADQKLLDSNYRLCWARLNPGSGSKGDTALQLHLDDTQGLDLAGVLRVFNGAQIVITGSTGEFSNRDHPSGMVPIWISEKDGEDPDGKNANQNKTALAQAVFSDPDQGVEIAVVVGVAQSGTGAFVLTLRDPLQLNHKLDAVKLNRGTESITVETTHHVGLLTHNIKIDGQDVQSAQVQGGTGCNNYVDPSMPGAMGFGISNQTHAQLMGMKVERTASTATACTFSANPVGSGGGVTFNYAKAGDQSKNITGECYSNFEDACKTRLTGNQRPPSGASLTGSWLFGTADASQCNAIFGGTCMFRYGSSVLLDSVELVRMGIAPNFGSLGQYAIHFHLFGYGKSFKGYLPPDSQDSHSRDAVVRNCSIWRSYSRFVTLHGACEVDVCNNVCAIGYGSGFFVEDGTELLNVFQHNLACCLFPCVPNKYFNPQGIMPNVSTDVCQLSIFWLKNNFNAVARNVGCCCPGNTTFVWYVPQLVGQLRGPSAVCMGSELYELPACGSMASIDGPYGLTAATIPENNKNGKIVKFRSCPGCACWVPKDFKFPLLDPTTGCNAYTSSNTETPVFLHSENVGYCLPLFHSELPEGINGGPQTMGEKTGCGGSDKGADGCSWFFQDDVAQPQFIPANGQNACTDSYVGTYPLHRWPLNNFPQPLNDDQTKAAEASCAQWTLEGLHYNMMPKFFSGVLTFNLGASTSLWGGAGWVKGVPAILIDCCFLETSSRISKPGGGTSMGVSIDNSMWGEYDSRTSAFFASNTNTNLTDDFPNLYTVLHNFLTNSAISISSNVTLISGDKTFFDYDFAALAVGGEYSTGLGSTLALATFDKDVNTLFGADIWKRSVYPFKNQIQIFEYGTDANKYYLCSNGSAPILKGNFRTPQGNWPGAPIKYPYVCGNSGLLLAKETQTPLENFQWLNGRVANAVTAQFQSGPAIDVGNRICTNLSKIWQNIPTVNNDQRASKVTPPLGWAEGQIPACTTAANFLI